MAISSAALIAGANLLAGGIGAVGSIMGSNTSASASAKAALMQIMWEQKRAKNAHQWEVEDLKKAGLNPILSAGGSGAQTSGISIPNTDTSGYSNAGNILASSAKAASDAYLDSINTETSKNVGESTSAKNNAETAKITTENKFIPEEKRAEIANKQATTETIKQDTALKEATMQDKIAQQAAETEKSISEGRISIDNAKFLAKYGITREEALKLGEVGFRELMSLIKTGAGIAQIDQAKKALLQTRKKTTNSGKKASK